MRHVEVPHAPVREAWLAQWNEAIIEPDLPIIDAHHHLWDRAGARYMFPDFLTDLQSGHRLSATVYVQCRSMYRTGGPTALRPVGEVEFANGVAALGESGLYGDTRVCAAIVGGADLRLGDDVAPVLDKMLAVSDGRLKGIRNPLAWHESGQVHSSVVQPPPGVMASTPFRRGVAHLVPRQLVLDIWAYHTQLDEVADLARAFPQLCIVVDHLGGPIGMGPYANRRKEVFDDWAQRLRRLVALPNVHMKLGGLGMPVHGFDLHLRLQPPTSLELAQLWRPYIMTCIEIFGADRCMFESNFSVDKGMFSYAVLWNAFKRLTTGCSVDERNALFYATAASIYHIAARE